MKAHALKKLMKANGWSFDRHRRGGTADVWINKDHAKVRVPHYKVIQTGLAKKIIKQCHLK